MNNLGLMHDHQIGVQKVYKKNSVFVEYEWGFSVNYNKKNITFYVLRNHHLFDDFIKDFKWTFTKINVNSNIELKLEGFKQTNLSSTFDNLIVVADLDKKKQAMARRASSFVKREGFEVGTLSVSEIKEMTEKWVARKMEDEKVFKITFNPNRYRNAIDTIGEEGYSSYSVRYKGVPAASIIFYNKDDVSYQLTYISDQDMERVVNDQFELFLWAAFNDRIENGARVIHMGTAGGIKSLAAFKKKFATQSMNGYGYSKTVEKEVEATKEYSKEFF
jgi:hypothetical protein